MYRTYAQLKFHFAERMRMLYTDTDSFIIQLTGCEEFHNDVYEELDDVEQDFDMFDFSNVPEGHQSGLHDDDAPNASKIGYFKSETNMDPIVEVVALRPKMYSYTVCDANTDPDVVPVLHSKKTFKGIGRAARDGLTHEDYVRMFRLQPAREGQPNMIINRRFHSDLHQMYTLEQRKRGLCPYDDKRYLLAPDPVLGENPNTHAYGHRLIPMVPVVGAQSPGGRRAGHRAASDCHGDAKATQRALDERRRGICRSSPATTRTTRTMGTMARPGTSRNWRRRQRPSCRSRTTRTYSRLLTQSTWRRCSRRATSAPRSASSVSTSECSGRRQSTDRGAAWTRRTRRRRSMRQPWRSMATPAWSSMRHSRQSSRRRPLHASTSDTGTMCSSG